MWFHPQKPGRAFPLTLNPFHFKALLFLHLCFFHLFKYLFILSLLFITRSHPNDQVITRSLSFSLTGYCCQGLCFSYLHIWAVHEFPPFDSHGLCTQSTLFSGVVWTWCPLGRFSQEGCVSVKKCWGCPLGFLSAVYSMCVLLFKIYNPWVIPIHPGRHPED